VQFVRYFGLYYGSFTLDQARAVYKCVPFVFFGGVFGMTPSVAAAPCRFHAAC
jgi:hypothetical protein